MKELIVKVLRWFLSIGNDKWLHLLFGLVIAQLVMLIPMTLCGRCLAALFAVLIIELCKENLIDSKMDWVDVLFTMIGCLIGIGLIVLTIVCL